MHGAVYLMLIANFNVRLKLSLEIFGKSFDENEKKINNHSRKV